MKKTRADVPFRQLMLIKKSSGGVWAKAGCWIVVRKTASILNCQSGTNLLFAKSREYCDRSLKIVYFFFFARMKNLWLLRTCGWSQETLKKLKARSYFFIIMNGSCLWSRCGCIHPKAVSIVWFRLKTWFSENPFCSLELAMFFRWIRKSCRIPKSAREFICDIAELHSRRRSSSPVEKKNLF